MKKPKCKKKRKPMSFSTFKRLVLRNSHKLPRLINIYGRRNRWVGIGWVDEGEARGDEVVIIEDNMKP